MNTEISDPARPAAPEIGIFFQCLAAFLLGSFYYVLGAISDGAVEHSAGFLPAAFFLVLTAAVFTTVAIALLLILGLPLRLNPTWKVFWKRRWWISIALGSIAFVMIVAGLAWPRLPDSVVPPEGSNFTNLAALLFWAGWLLTVFVVLHHYPPFLPRPTAVKTDAD